MSDVQFLCLEQVDKVAAGFQARILASCSKSCLVLGKKCCKKYKRGKKQCKTCPKRD